jgi:hypothetical protein
MELDEWLVAALQAGTVKKCPFCGILSELISGCNYVTCVCKQGNEQKSEWCWLCNQPKYSVCNDPTHNSH